MSRRNWVGVAAAASLALVLSACGSSTTPDSGASTSTSSGPESTSSAAVDTSEASDATSESPSSDASSEAPGAAATLVVWADDTRAKPLADIAKKFEADTGAKVTIVQKDFGKLRDDFISQAPTGKGPDVLVGANDWLGKLVQNGVVAPIELGDAAKQYEPVALTAMSYDGKLYGLPYATENIALIRNTALAPTAPATFQEAVAFGQKLVSEGKAKFPFLIQQDAKSGDPYHLYPLQTSFGAPVFGTTADGTYDPKDLAMGGANGQKFAQYLATLGKEGVLKGTISFDVSKEAFIKGQSPYIITGPWNTGDFTKAGIKFSVEAVPSAGGQPSQPFVGVQGFYISAKSTNQLLANNFVVNYLGTEEVQLALYDAGGRPPAMISAFDKVKSDPVIAGFGAVGANGTPQPNIPEMDAVWSDWGTTELAIIQGKGDPVQLWDKMVASIQSKIAG